MRHKAILSFLTLLLLATLACQLTSAGGVSSLPTAPGIALPTPLAPPPTLGSATATTAAAATPSPAATVTPATTGTPACTYATAFVADVTIPDDTAVPAGQAFSKTWRIRNTGSCALPDGAAWVPTDGARMAGPDAVPLPPLAAGATTDVTVDLTAPTAAGTHTGYWQVRLPSGSLLRTRYFVRVVVPAATAVPPTATPTTAPDPAVDYFRANVTIADPGDEIALQWATQHADSATIYYLLGGQLSTSWQVPATGSMTYAIRPSERNRITFALYAARAGTDQFAQATLELPLTCPVTWFFTPAPDECAQDAALQSPGAEQPFEHGVMLWVEAQNRIYVLYDGPDANGEWTVYEDTWTPDDPVEDPNIDPPAGFYEPERGFGLVWRTYPEVRQRLGWATAPEQAFSTAYQSTARYKYNESYLRALDGGVYHLLPERSGWEKIA